MQRPGKEKVWPANEMAGIVDIINNPKAILWDNTDDGFLYVGEGGKPKTVVVKMHRQPKAGRFKIETNTARTTADIPLRDLRNPGHFTIIRGTLD